MFVYLATPAPSAPPIPLGPDYSFIEVLNLGWIVDGFLALLLLLVGIGFIALLVNRLREGWGTHPGVWVACTAASWGGALWLGINSTNEMPEGLRPLTSVGFVVILIVGLIFASRSRA